MKTLTKFFKTFLPYIVMLLLLFGSRTNVFGQCGRANCSYITPDVYNTWSTSYQTKPSNSLPDGTYYHRYDFYLTSGHTYDFSLCSGDGGAASFDSYLCLYGYGYGCGYTSFLTSNDDMCGNVSAIYNFTATQDGWTSLYVSGYSSNYGSYTLAYRDQNACTTPGTPTSLSASATGQTTANLSWAAGSPAGSATVTYYYNVYTSGGSYVTGSSTTGTSTSVSGLSCGTSYYFTLYANTSCNGTSSSTATSSTFTTSSCGPPCGTNMGSISPGNCAPSTASYSANTVPYWSFTATANYFYHFSLDGNTTEDTYLTLYNSSGAQIATNDDGGIGAHAFLNWQCTSGGTYYIMASHCCGPCNNVQNAGSLKYWITDDGNYGNMDTYLYPTTSWQNYSYSAGSFYYFYFNATAGNIYDFSLCDNPEDSYLYIYNSSWGFITGNDDNGPHCGGVPASISWTCPTTDTYIIQVNNLGCDPFINSGTLAYRYASPCNIPSDPSASGATTICSGGSASISATSTNATTIYWYTGGCGSTSVGTSSPGSGFSVSPGSTTTYYARGYNSMGSGCWSSGCGSVTITVGQVPVNPTVSGTATICNGASTNISATSTNATTIYWYTGSCGGTQVGTSAPGANFS
ncbi:MAG TPA: hypothetical protein PLL90_07950, partial [Bacteroidales bacterium]|nr:hypothetical protein [Bacteroidales bacterium]